MSAIVIHLGPRMPNRRPPNVYEDPQVQRETRRYRALRQLGRTDGLCETCRALIWHMAGDELMPDQSMDDPGVI